MPTATSYLSEDVDDGADDDVVLWREDNPEDDKTPTINDQLSPTQKRELQESWKSSLTPCRTLLGGLPW